MARMYFGFNTNLTEAKEGFCHPQVDYIAFDNKEKKLHISVSCNEESDFGVKNHPEGNVYCARFKGLEVSVEDYEGKTIHEYEDMTEEDFNLLKDAVPYEIGMYFSDDSEKIEDSVICRNFDANIQFGEDIHSYKAKSVPVMEYGD